MSGRFKATRVAINTRFKTLLAARYRGLARRAWSFSTEQFWDYQADAFNKIYAHARANVPYYHTRPELYPPLTATGATLLETLGRLPVLTKPVLREFNEQLWVQPLPRFTKFHSTSGTSGTPVRLPQTLWEKGFFNAIEAEWLKRLTGRAIPRTLGMSGFFSDDPNQPLFWRDPVFGDAWLSIYALRPENADRIAEFLRKVRPQAIYGYASAIHQLARTLGDRVADSREERVALPTSEVLEPEWRSEIVANLAHKCCDHYGSQEGMHRCFEFEGYYYIHPLSGVVELLDQAGQPAPAGEVGRVVVTGLYRRAMPLFRYEIGDSAYSTGYAIEPAGGLAWPTIGRVLGRSEDLVRMRDGRRIGMLSYVLLKEVSGIKESQIAQKGFEHFVFRLVPNAEPGVDLKAIENQLATNLRKRLAIDCTVEFEYLDEIPRGSRGKFKAVVVEFNPDAPELAHT